MSEVCIGDRFGKLTVRSRQPNKLGYALCYCDCGVRCNVRTTRLLDGTRTGCGKCTQVINGKVYARNAVSGRSRRGPTPSVVPASRSYVVSVATMERYLASMPLPPFRPLPPPRFYHVVTLDCGHVNRFGEYPPEVGTLALCMSCADRRGVVDVKAPPTELAEAVAPASDRRRNGLLTSQEVEWLRRAVGWQPSWQVFRRPLPGDVPAPQPQP